MAKASINTGTDAQAVHTRTTSGAEESQAVVVAIDGSDAVVPATVATGLLVGVARLPAVDTELPAAAALSDTMTNPTTPIVGSGDLIWNSTASRWERARSAEAVEAAAALTGTDASALALYEKASAS
jgi:hypothetical protein